MHLSIPGVSSMLIERMDAISSLVRLVQETAYKSKNGNNDYN